MHIWFACSANMENGTSAMLRMGVELPDATSLLLTEDTLEQIEDLIAQQLANDGHEPADVHILSWQEYGG